MQTTETKTKTKFVAIKTTTKQKLIKRKLKLYLSKNYFLNIFLYLLNSPFVLYCLEYYVETVCSANICSSILRHARRKRCFYFQFFFIYSPRRIHLFRF